MDGIRSLGSTISIDDFGTGYSSLVRNFTEISEDETIARSIVLLGHSLGLSVVAEGVETKLHESLLREMGCDVGQGYLYAKPVPTDALPLRVENGKAYVSDQTGEN